MNKIIAVSGRAQSGKDTFALLLNEILREEGKEEYKVLKFASALKKIASILLGVEESMFEDADFKNSVLGPEWNHMTVRTLLRKLGTEAVRNNICENAWINCLADTIKNAESNVIITDLRFPNEAEYIKSEGGIIVNIVTPLSFKPSEHSSEIDLEFKLVDEYIGNFGSLHAYKDLIYGFYKRRLC